MVEQECIPAGDVNGLRAPDDGFHFGQVHLLGVDQFNARQPIKRAGGVIKPVIDVQPGLRQECNASIRFAGKIRPACFNNIADVVFARGGEKMQIHQISQNDWLILGNDNRMLELCGNRIIRRAQ